MNSVGVERPSRDTSQIFAPLKRSFHTSELRHAIFWVEGDFKIVFRKDNILKSVTSIQVVLTFNQGLIHVSEIGNSPLLMQILHSHHSEKITNFYYAVLVLF